MSWSQQQPPSLLPYPQPHPRAVFCPLGLRGSGSQGTQMCSRAPRLPHVLGVGRGRALLGGPSSLVTCQEVAELPGDSLTPGPCAGTPPPHLAPILLQGCGLTVTTHSILGYFAASEGDLCQGHRQASRPPPQPRPSPKGPACQLPARGGQGPWWHKRALGSPACPLTYSRLFRVLLVRRARARSWAPSGLMEFSRRLRKEMTLSC